MRPYMLKNGEAHNWQKKELHIEALRAYKGGKKLRRLTLELIFYGLV